MMPDIEILQTIAPDVQVIVWSDNKPLDENTPHFQTIDYLLDGLLRKQTENRKDLDQVIFVHNLFGKNFWVAFANTSRIQVNDFVTALRNIIPEDGREKMVVLNHEVLPSNWVQPLDKFFGFIEKI
jgi:hypothetical protein